MQCYCYLFSLDFFAFFTFICVLILHYHFYVTLCFCFSFYFLYLFSQFVFFSFCSFPVQFSLLLFSVALLSMSLVFYKHFSHLFSFVFHFPLLFIVAVVYFRFLLLVISLFFVISKVNITMYVIFCNHINLEGLIGSNFFQT